MPESAQQLIARSVRAADGVYNRLVLLVGQVKSGKTTTLRSVADDFNANIMNLNLKVAETLLDLSSRQRALRLPQALDQLLDATSSPVFMDNLEILFDKDLKQDPLRLLQNLSRNRTIVATWAGAWTNGRLTYAELGHREFRSYESVDALIVDMDGRSTIATQ